MTRDGRRLKGGKRSERRLSRHPSSAAASGSIKGTDFAAKRDEKKLFFCKNSQSNWKFIQSFLTKNKFNNSDLHFPYIQTNNRILNFQPV